MVGIDVTSSCQGVAPKGCSHQCPGLQGAGKALGQRWMGMGSPLGMWESTLVTKGQLGKGNILQVGRKKNLFSRFPSSLHVMPKGEGSVLGHSWSHGCVRACSAEAPKSCALPSCPGWFHVSCFSPVPPLTPLGSKADQKMKPLAPHRSMSLSPTQSPPASLHYSQTPIKLLVAAD